MEAADEPERRLLSLITDTPVSNNGHTAHFRLGHSKAAYEAIAAGKTYPVQWQDSSSGQLREQQEKIKFRLDPKRSYEFRQVSPGHYVGRQIYTGNMMNYGIATNPAVMFRVSDTGK